MPPPTEKMSGITAFSTQLTPKTDGASKHCSAAQVETMATARQQKACQANRREECSAVEAGPRGRVRDDDCLMDVRLVLKESGGESIITGKIGWNSHYSFYPKGLIFI